MRSHPYCEIPWTLQVPITCDMGQISTLVDFDCTLSFLGDRLEGVHVVLESNGKSVQYEIGDLERDRNLAAIWDTAKYEFETSDDLKAEFAEHQRESSYERLVCAAEQRWELMTSR